MTPLSRILAIFPAFHLACIGASLFGLLTHPSWIWLAAFGISVYGLPVCVCRIINMFRPVREGPSRLDERRYSPWWGAHQLQVLYITVPQLEGVLRMIPGCFSLWLRLWGSRIGRGVYWTPRVEIVDRNLMEIGDRVIFGHQVTCYAHAVRRKNGRVLLFVRKVHIGDHAFVGAYSRIGPGVRIEQGSTVPILTDLYPNRVYEEEREPYVPV